MPENVLITEEEWLLLVQVVVVPKKRDVLPHASRPIMQSLQTPVVVAVVATRGP